MQTQEKPVETEKTTMAERLRALAMTLDLLGIAPRSVIVDSLSNRVHVSLTELRTLFSGCSAKSELIDGWVHFTIVRDGITYTACELSSVRTSQVCL